MKECNIILAGIRFQDLVKIAQIIGQAAAAENLNFIGTDHTFVSIQPCAEYCHLRIGEEVYSPFIPKGKCDVVVGFLPGEGAREAAEYLKSSGAMIANTREVYPILFFPPFSYYPRPQETLEYLSRLAERLITLDAVELARKAGDQDAMNLVMLGALAASDLIPIRSDTIRDSIKQLVPPAEQELSLQAFQAGIEAVNH